MEAGPTEPLCYGPGSIVGAILGTFFTTCLLLVVAGFFYRHWRRNKGKHLVLVTDPEIVDAAYAFDNPCFKDSTPAGGRNLERPSSLAGLSETTTPAITKDSRWFTPWSNLAAGRDKRCTLDDSYLGPKVTRTNVIELRSRDFTGLGFNVCGNMREGIFVKDLLHRGPASESGRIHPGDRISSIKISFRSMVYEDALTILSYASPYRVELEVETGIGGSSKPTTLLKKSVGPNPTHICHPLYRSQSIPELSQHQSSGRKYGSGGSTSKRLFAIDPYDLSYSNYSTMNSTIRSSKSTPGCQTLERHHEELLANKANNYLHHHPKFGIKVLPAIDGTVHRVENQNEHNLNLERRHSKKIISSDQTNPSNGSFVNAKTNDEANKLANCKNIASGSIQRRSVISIGGKKVIRLTESDSFDVPDRAVELGKENLEKSISAVIPSKLPTEVHNAAMAARRNRKSTGPEQLEAQKLHLQIMDAPELNRHTFWETADLNESKSPQKAKRKAPAPPLRTNSNGALSEIILQDEKTLNGNSDSKEGDRLAADFTIEISLGMEETKEQAESVDEGKAMQNEQSKHVIVDNHRHSESDTDSEIQNSFTTIELNPSDIIVHHTPVPEGHDKEDNVDDVYRKAASLGDLSKYENKTSTTLERAQSLDMTDTSFKKRKAPVPSPEDIHESTEDLTKLDQVEVFDRRKLKKFNEWGTLEGAIWKGPATDTLDNDIQRAIIESNAIEKSKSNIKIQSTKDKNKDEINAGFPSTLDEMEEANLELYKLPCSKRLIDEFIRAERLFNTDEDNALLRTVHDDNDLKASTPQQLNNEFRKSHEGDVLEKESNIEELMPDVADPFKKAIQHFDFNTHSSPQTTEINFSSLPEKLYAGKKEVIETPMLKVTLNLTCPGCEYHDHKPSCEKSKTKKSKPSYYQTIKVADFNSDVEQVNQTANRKTYLADFETHFAKPVIPESNFENDDEASYEFGTTITVGSKNLSPSPVTEKCNVSNVSVSSGENSEDSRLVHESNSSTPLIGSLPKNIACITEQILPMNRKSSTNDVDNYAASNNKEIIPILPESSFSQVILNVTSNGKLPAGKKPPVPPRRSSDATKLVTRDDNTSPEKQVVYVSEYKSPIKKDEDSGSDSSIKFENRLFFKNSGKERNSSLEK